MREWKSEEPAGKARNDENVELGGASGQIRCKGSSDINDLMKDDEQLHDCETTQDEQSPGCGNANRERGHRPSKSNKKKYIILPRRVSKRLAGIEVDTPELKRSTRARRADSKQSDNSSGCSSQQPQKQDFDPVLQEVHAKSEENSPLADFFADPCIAFAIKTLKDQSENEATDNMSYEKQECSVLPLLRPPSKVVKQEKHDFVVGTGETLGWPDPCIEFAIKTLTGAIPLEYEPHIEEYFQKQLGSAQQHKDNLRQKKIA